MKSNLLYKSLFKCYYVKFVVGNLSWTMWSSVSDTFGHVFSIVYCINYIVAVILYDSYILYVTCALHVERRFLFTFCKNTFIFVVDLVMKKCIKMISDFLISFWYTFSYPSSPINARTEIHHRTQESPNRTTLVKVKNGLVHWALFKYWTDVKTSNKSPLEILVNELVLYELRFTINHSQLLFNGRTHFNKTIIEKTSNDLKIIATARFERFFILSLNSENFSFSSLNKIQDKLNLFFIWPESKKIK